jgi:hypothetical protein
LETFNTQDDKFTNVIIRDHPETFEEFKAKLYEDAGDPEKIKHDFLSLRRALQGKLIDLPLDRQKTVRTDMDNAEQAFMRVADDREKTLELINSLVLVQK